MLHVYIIHFAALVVCILSSSSSLLSLSASKSSWEGPSKIINKPLVSEQNLIHLEGRYLATTTSNFLGMATSQSTRPDLSELPPELKDIISNKMIDISDYVRLRAVCKAWRSATTPPSFAQHVPWLLLPYNPDTCTRSFFSLSTHRIHSFTSPQFQGRVTYGSAHGWLVMIDRSFSVSLVNPLTESFIQLPPVTHLPDFATFHFELHGDEFIYRRHVAGVSGKVNYDMIWHILLCCAFSSSSSTPMSDFVVTVTSYLSPRFLCYRSGDERWTLVNSTLTCGIDSLTRYEDKLYLVGIDGSAVVCEVYPQLRAELVPSLEVPGDFRCCYFGTRGGKLLLVTSYMQLPEDEEGRGEGVSISTFELDVKAMSWAKVEGGVDDCMLLLTENGFTSAERGAFGCKGDYACFRAIRSKVSERHHKTEVVQMEEEGCRILPCLWVTEMEALGPAWFAPSI